MIIEDDLSLRDAMINMLERYGYKGVYIKDFRNIENEVIDVNPHLIFLDINLPYFDGFYYIKAIRKISKAPVIIISARNSAGDQILGLELGADDYLIKPFDTEILLAKVKSVIRRIYGELSVEDKKMLTVGGLILDESRFKASYKGHQVTLSKNEFLILKRLIEHQGEIVKREVLFEDIWDDKEFVDENTLTVNITRVKGKLDELGLQEVIKTKRGIGYILSLNH
ncbi:MAG: response regulator transcription factor [Vallitaleaceae bacterium]|nr:response regulator transcription factor [Vallitaleaceae bacterium]